MQLTSIALAFAVFTLSVLSAPISMIDERSPDAKADAKASSDHAYPIEVEGMLARLEKKDSAEKRSAGANANVDHAYPIEVEGMLARLE